MINFEYKIVPAPVHGMRVRGVSEPEDRFALSLEIVINEMAAEGWEYMRSETLPSAERSGLVGSAPVYRGILVFRREATAKPKPKPEVAEAQPKIEKKRRPLLMRPRDDRPPVRIRTVEAKPAPSEPEKVTAGKTAAATPGVQHMRGNTIESAIARARGGTVVVQPSERDTAKTPEARPEPAEDTTVPPVADAVEFDEPDHMEPVDLSADEDAATPRATDVKVPPRQDTGISGLLRRRAVLIQAAAEKGEPRPAPLADLATLFADAEDAEEIVDETPKRSTAAE